MGEQPSIETLGGGIVPNTLVSSFGDEEDEEEEENILQASRIFLELGALIEKPLFEGATTAPFEGGSEEDWASSRIGFDDDDDVDDDDDDEEEDGIIREADLVSSF